MSCEGRYGFEAPESQRQGYHNFLQNSISFCNMGVEDSYVDSLDPEKLMQCPYDKNHQIRACRFPYHLVKCRKNHPDIVQKLVTCPFNARHQIPRAEISQHISSCDDKRCIEQDIGGQNLRGVEVHLMIFGENMLHYYRFFCLHHLGDQSRSIFIWGQGHTGLNSSTSNTTVGLKNHLGTGLRAPRSLPQTLPWKNYAGN